MPMRKADRDEPNDLSRHKVRWSRWLSLVGIAVPIGLFILAAVVLPGWVPLWPRAVRRALTEAFLRGVLFGYAFLLMAGTVAFPVLAGLLLRSQRQRRRHPVLAKLTLVSCSCLVALIALEIGSAALRSWTHRFPVLPTSFPEREPGTYRIVVVGGSSALGEPYRPWLSVGQIVAWKLQEAVPDRKFEVDILAFLGDSLEQQHQKLSAIKYRPDAMIIYSGHNEFAARFEEDRDAPLDEEPGLSVLRLAYRASLHSPFCRLVYELVSKNRLDRPPSLEGRHQLIDPPLCSPSESAEVLADFSARLEALAAYCERLGILPVLISPPANEADYEPSRSTVPPGTTAEDRDRLARDFEAARASEASDPEGSRQRYLDILRRHPTFAEAHYRLGRLWLAERRADEARRHFSQALENDGLPIRCQAPFRAVYSQVAARHPGCLLIDGRAELMRASPSGLLDDHVLEDTHHPNLKGYAALASAVLRTMSDREVFGSAIHPSLPVDPVDCRRHFELGADRLATAFERTSVHYQRVAGYRYDPAERMRKSRRFAEAARKLREGVPLEAIGLPELSDALNLLDLPVLQIDRGASAEKMDDGHELVLLTSADHDPFDPLERSGHDPHLGPHRRGGLGLDRDAGAEHGLDLPEVAIQSPLIGDLQDRRQPPASERLQPVPGIAVKKEITREQRDHRARFSALRRPPNPRHLREIKREPQLAHLARGGLLLPGLRVQTPPDAVRLLAGIKVFSIPEIRRIILGLGGKDRHSFILSDVKTKPGERDPTRAGLT